MKKPYCFLFFSVLFFCTLTIAPLTAESKESDLYYINAQILKIFQHQKGYCVLYHRAGKGTAELFLPKKWFKLKENKANMSRINTRINPYISFFIRNGECEYVRVYAPRDLQSQIWGTFQYPHEYDEQFEDAASIPLNF